MGRSLMTLMASGLGGFSLYTEINEPLPDITFSNLVNLFNYDNT